MSWSHFIMPPVTDLTGSLAAGGTLDANTTYYFRVVATAATANTTRPFCSEYSNQFSITTDATNRTVNLSWTAVTNPLTSAPAPGYNVLVAKDSTYLDNHPDITLTTSQDLHHAASYFTPSTLTNSYTVASNPTLSYMYAKDGLPFLRWNGSTTMTFDSLYEYMTVTEPSLSGFVEPLKTRSPVAPPFGYIFHCNIEIQRFTGETAAGVFSVDQSDRVIIVMGSIGTTANIKYRLVNNLISNFTMSHSNGSGWNTDPVSGTISTGNRIAHTIGTTGVHFKGRQGKQWQDSGWTTFEQSSSNTGVSFSGNQYMTGSSGGFFAKQLSSNVANSSFTTGTNVTTFQTGHYTSANYERMRKGGDNIKVVNPMLRWGSPPMVCGVRWTNQSYEYHQFWAPSHYVDCVWEYTSDPYITVGQKFTDQVDYNFRVGTTSIYGALRLPYKTFSIDKSVVLTVVDQDNNPIVGAKAVTLNKDGVNVTRPFLSTNITRIMPAGYTQHNLTDWINDEYVWLASGHSFVSNGWALGDTTPVIGKTYWLGSEKITITEDQGNVGAAHANLRKYGITRGVGGTIRNRLQTSDSFLTSTDTMLLTDAPEFTTSDASGKVYLHIPIETYRYTGTFVWGTRTTANMLTDGTIEKFEQVPITIRISASGYQTTELVVDRATAIALENLQIKMTIKLKKGFDVGIVSGKPVLNLDPSNSTNILFEKL